MLYHSTTIKSLSSIDCSTDSEVNCGKYFIFLFLLAEGDDFSLVTFTLTFDTNVTFDQGNNDSSVQVLAINIWDDQLLEGTESFVISSNATPPASFVAGGDTVTVNILDSDGKGKLLHTSS